MSKAIITIARHFFTDAVNAEVFANRTILEQLRKHGTIEVHLVDSPGIVGISVLNCPDEFDATVSPAGGVAFYE